MNPSPRLLPRFLVLLLACLALPSCGIRDLTRSLTELSQEATNLLAQVEEGVSSGQLSQELGQVLDDRIGKVTKQLDGLLTSQVGAAFDRLDGSLALVFDELRTTIGAIRAELLGGSVEELLQTLSQQLTVQVSTLSARAEDLVFLGIGGATVVVDAAANSIFVWTSLGGAILIVLVLILARPKSWFFRIVGLGLIALLVVVGLVAPIRAWILSNLELGQRIEALEPQPRLDALLPQTFTIGETQDLSIFGSRLDKIDDLAVALFEPGRSEPAFTFPAAAIVGVTSSRITLKNFAQTLGWAQPKYAAFRASVLPKVAHAAGKSLPALEADYSKLSLAAGRAQLQLVTKFRFQAVAPGREAADGPQSIGLRGVEVPTRIRSRLESLRGGPPQAANVPTKPGLHLSSAEMASFRASAMALAGVTNDAELVKEQAAVFFREQYKIAAGDYVLQVSSGAEVLVTKFPITIAYPPPPPPLPNIQALAVELEGDAAPVIGESRRARVTIGIRNADAIQSAFTITVTSAPVLLQDQVIPVTATQAQAALQTGGTLTLGTRPFRITQTGALTLTAQVDPSNAIQELSETDNVVKGAVSIGEYVYDATVTFLTFEALRDFDGKEKDEYRVQMQASGGSATHRFSFSKSGNPGRAYAMNKTCSFEGLRRGDRIAINFVAREADSGIRGGDDFMGSNNFSFQVPTPDKDQVMQQQTQATKEGRNAQITVKVDYMRRKTT